MRIRKPRIGDIYEITGLRGLSYLQFTHEAQDGTQLVRVLPGIHLNRPSDFFTLSHQDELYFTFTILVHALRKREIVLVSNQPIPDWAKPFPTMRKAAGRSKDGKIIGWYIGNGLRLYTVQEMQQAVYVRGLTPEQNRLSIASIWPASTLREKIEQGWTPEHAEKFEQAARKEIAGSHVQRKGIQKAQSKTIDHYFYFLKKHNAHRAGHELQIKGWKVDVKMGGDGKSWLLLAKQPAPIDRHIADVRDEMEHLAAEFHGEYDGWGAAV
jgi:hypothetical protein